MKNLEVYLRYGILTGLFLILCIPLLVTSSLYFPYISGKAFAFRIIIECVAALWIVLICFKKEYRPKFSILLSLFAAFVVSIGVSNVLGVDLYRSFWSNSERMEGFIGLLHLFAYFVIAGSMITTERLWMYFFKASLGVSVIVSVYAVIQLLESTGGGIRLESTLGNAIYLAVYILFHIFLTLFFFIRSRGVGEQWVYVAIGLFQLFILYNTGTRGTIIGLVAGVAVTSILVALFARGCTKARKVATGILLGLLILIGGFYVLRDTSFVQENHTLRRFTDISITDGTGNARFLVWEIAMRGIAERPVFGWGQENFHYVFNQYYNPELIGNETWFDRTHNVVFDWFIAGGAVGTLLYLSLFVSTMYLIWKNKSKDLSVIEKSLFTGLLVAYFIHNLFVFDNNVSYISFLSILAYVHFQNGREWFISKWTEIDRKKVANIIMPVVVLASIFILYVVNGKPIIASQTLVTALGSKNTETYNYDLFREVFAYDTFINAEAMEQLSFFVLDHVYVPNAVSADLRKDFYDLTEEQFLTMISRKPNDVRVVLFAGLYFRRSGDISKALVYLERAKELSPNKQDILIELGMTYQIVGRPEEALALFERVYQLRKNDIAKVVYGTALIDGGERVLEGEEILNTISNDFYYSNPIVVSIFTFFKQDDRVEEIMLNAIEKNPDSIDLKIDLVEMYLHTGMEDKALMYLEHIAEVHPELREQVDMHSERIRTAN